MLTIRHAQILQLHKNTYGPGNLTLIVSVRPANQLGEQDTMIIILGFGNIVEHKTL